MITIDLWLYGPLSKYGGEANQGSHAQLALKLPEGATMQTLLDRIEMPLNAKGITFVNRQLSDMPGLGTDLERELADGDRVAIFHEKSMWPYQYRHGASTSTELQDVMETKDGGLHHSYR